jgi:hypothetical protein
VARPTQRVTYVIRGSSSPPQCHIQQNEQEQHSPTQTQPRRVPAQWARAIRSPAPVRGLTPPFTPLPFHRRVETRSQTFSPRAILPCDLAARVDELVQNLDSRHVDRRSSVPPSRHAIAVLCRRFADRLQLLRRSNKGSTNRRGHTPRRGHRPCVTQELLRYSHTDPARPSRLHHLQHWQRSPAGSREEMFCAVTSSTRDTLRNNQESSPGRLRPSVSLHGCIYFVSAHCSISACSPPRNIQRSRAVQA